MYDALRKVNNASDKEKMVAKICELLCKDGQILASYLDDMLATDVIAEHRSDHKDWFDGNIFGIYFDC